MGLAAHMALLGYASYHEREFVRERLNQYR